MVKIETYVLARNEELLMPYILRHYKQYGDVIILESNSTDRTVEIAIAGGATVYQYDTKDEVNDSVFIQIKESCWKNSKADWVIVVDADEFVYHPDLIGILERTDSTVIHPKYWNMFTETFPTTSGQIYEEVNMGTDKGVSAIWGTKTLMFKPSEIKRMNWDPGCHGCNPEGNVRIEYNSGIMTLHMRFLSRQHLIERYTSEAKRMSILNIYKGWGTQFFWSAKQINKIFDETMPTLKRII